VAESNKLKIGIVTVSDRASRGEYEDLGGPALLELLKRVITSPFETISRIVPDECSELEETLIELADKLSCALIITTGGTGPAPRDITVDATLAIAERTLPGFGELMREVSRKKTPTAILSRQTAVTRGASLIINLPGSPKAISECLLAVFPAIPDCIDLLGNGSAPIIETDPTLVKAHRPH
jgi:molybdopterin adenylyltransferase